MFTVLAAERRRQFVLALLGGPTNEPVSLPGSARNERIPIVPERFRLELVHEHLPMLADHGFVDWEDDRLVASRGPRFDEVAIFDYKDEYRGLIKAGLANHYIVGDRETAWSVDDWETFFESNPKVVLARHRLKPEEWREVAAKAVQALRNLAGPSRSALAGVDEAHFVAPQSGKISDPIEGLATTGRGEGASSMWITQRLATLDETVGSQCDERIVGGFSGDRDRGKIDPEYPEDVHNPQARSIARLPEELRVDGENLPLRRFEENGSTIGPEWVYSNNKGEMERRDTREMDMQTTHYGPEGHPIHDPA